MILILIQEKDGLQMSKTHQYEYNCNFYNFDDINTEIRVSFNHADTYRLFKECSFNSPTWLSNHNNFNSGIFEDCIFTPQVLYFLGKMVVVPVLYQQ